jgi:hypothetical protein
MQHSHYMLAVTVDGTVIHKSGLITGGRSLHSNDKKWSDQDYKGTCFAAIGRVGLELSPMYRASAGARYLDADAGRTSQAENSTSRE